jgi:hypothetical protein
MMLLAGSAGARDAGLLAFSRDGSQALIERSGLLEVHRPPDGSFALANGVLSRGDLTLASDGEKVVLARAN